MKAAKRRFILILLIIGQVVSVSEHITQSNVPESSKNSLGHKAKESRDQLKDESSSASPRSLMVKLIEQQLTHLSSQANTQSKQERLLQQIDIKTHMFRDVDTCGCLFEKVDDSNSAIIPAYLTYDSVIKRLNDLSANHQSFSIAGWRISRFTVEEKKDETKKWGSVSFDVKLYDYKDVEAFNAHSILIEISPEKGQDDKVKVEISSQEGESRTKTSPEAFERDFKKESALIQTCAFASEIVKTALRKIARNQFTNEKREKPEIFQTLSFDWCLQSAKYSFDPSAAIVKLTLLRGEAAQKLPTEKETIVEEVTVNKTQNPGIVEETPNNNEVIRPQSVESPNIPQQPNTKAETLHSKPAGSIQNFIASPSQKPSDSKIRKIFDRHYGSQIPFTRVLGAEVVERIKATNEDKPLAYDVAALLGLLKMEDCPFNVENLCRQFSYIKRLPWLGLKINNNNDPEKPELALDLPNGLMISVILSEPNELKGQHCAELELLMLHNSVNHIACWPKPEVSGSSDSQNKDHQPSLFFHEVIDKIYSLALLAETDYHWQVSQLDILRAIVLNAKKDETISEIPKIFSIKDQIKLEANDSLLPKIENDFNDLTIITETSSLVTFSFKSGEVTFTGKIDSESERYHFVTFESASQLKELLIPKSIDDFVQDLTSVPLATLSDFYHIDAFIGELASKMEQIKLLSLQNRFSKQVTEFIEAIKASSYDLTSDGGSLGIKLYNGQITLADIAAVVDTILLSTKYFVKIYSPESLQDPSKSTDSPLSPEFHEKNPFKNSKQANSKRFSLAEKTFAALDERPLNLFESGASEYEKQQLCQFPVEVDGEGLDHFKALAISLKETVQHTIDQAKKSPFIDQNYFTINYGIPELEKLINVSIFLLNQGQLKNLHLVFKTYFFEQEFIVPLSEYDKMSKSITAIAYRVLYHYSDVVESFENSSEDSKLEDLSKIEAILQSFVEDHSKNDPKPSICRLDDSGTVHNFHWSLSSNKVTTKDEKRRLKLEPIHFDLPHQQYKIQQSKLSPIQLAGKSEYSDFCSLPVFYDRQIDFDFPVTHQERELKLTQHHLTIDTMRRLNIAECSDKKLPPNIKLKPVELEDKEILKWEMKIQSNSAFKDHKVPVESSIIFNAQYSYDYKRVLSSFLKASILERKDKIEHRLKKSQSSENKQNGEKNPKIIR